jgi:hypothetical protein
MNHLHRLWPFLAVALLASLFCPASAQTENPPEVTEEMLEKSHLSEALAPSPDLAAKIEALVKKRQSEQYRKIFEQLKQGKLNYKEAMKDRAFLKGLRDDPRIPPSVKKLLDQYMDPEHAPALSPKDIEALREFAKDVGPRPEAEEKNNTPGKPEKAPEPAGDENSSLGGIGRGGTGSGGQTTEKQQELAQRLMKWLGGSPAMRQALRDLGRHLGEEDPRWQRLSSGIETMKERWGRWGQMLELDRLGDEDGRSWLARRFADSIPQFSWPSWEPPSAGPLLNDEIGSRSLPGVSGPWLLFASLAGAIAAAIAGWAFLARSRRLLEGREHPDWKLGPWPVNPREVLSRREMVLAFEYLSLLNLGPDARNWNHRVIATRLAEEKILKKHRAIGVSEPTRSKPVEMQPVNDPLHQLVVGELASVYEQARYAPPGDTLSEASLESARRNFCLLAGEVAA